MIYDRWNNELASLRAAGNLRKIPDMGHDGAMVTIDGKRLLNLSSNDYMGVAADAGLRREFMATDAWRDSAFSASSSRLMTGNYGEYDRLEAFLAESYHTESALVLNCGYHANTGIIPALTGENSLILADKLIHASLIDGLRLCRAKSIRFRHNDYAQLESLVEKYATTVSEIFIVVESIYSMDGDAADLRRIIALRRRYPNVLLYVDEAHAVGVRGNYGLGLAEELHCIDDIDFLVGTFGKAVGSAGAFVVCRSVAREMLVNKMRPFIFTTALPPLTVAWTEFVLRAMRGWLPRRRYLGEISARVAGALASRGGQIENSSHIIPWIVGDSAATIAIAGQMQRKGFYCLPVRPPTVPEGTSRIRLSLNAAMAADEVDDLIKAIKDIDL